MADREKVIRGLESLWRCISPVSHTCGDCPYQDNRVECKRRVVTDALSLLKEQEARVIYATEIQLDIVYWMEKRNIMQPWPVAFIRLYGNPDKLVYEDYYGEKWTISGYRVGEKGWRCWTSRPTPEQMRDTKWEGENETM